MSTYTSGVYQTSDISMTGHTHEFTAAGGARTTFVQEWTNSLIGRSNGVPTAVQDEYKYLITHNLNLAGANVSSVQVIVMASKSDDGVGIDEYGPAIQNPTVNSHTTNCGFAVTAFASNTLDLWLENRWIDNTNTPRQYNGDYVKIIIMDLSPS